MTILLQGKFLGTHNGIINYTIGQRKGLGISNKNPLYVVKIDATNNQIIVGLEKDLTKQSLKIEELIPIIVLNQALNLKARLRKPI